MPFRLTKQLLLFFSKIKWQSGWILCIERMVLWHFLLAAYDWCPFDMYVSFKTLLINYVRSHRLFTQLSIFMQLIFKLTNLCKKSVLVLMVQNYTILILGILYILCICLSLESTWWWGWSFDSGYVLVLIVYVFVQF